MSTNLRIIAINDFDSASISVSPAVVTSGKFAADNVQDERRSRALRSTSTADQVITGSWSEDVLISGVIIGQHNCSSGATGRVQLYSDEAATVEVLDTRVDGADFDMLYKKSLGSLDFGITPLGDQISDYDFNNTPVWVTPTKCRAVKITISDSDNEDGYIQVGRIIAGRYITPQVNMDLGYLLTPVDESTQSRTAGSTLHSELGARYQRIRFKLSWLAEGDRERFTREMRRVGKVSQVYLSLFPTLSSAEEIDHQMIAKLVSDPGYVGGNQTFTDTTYTFSEA
jgi:hypothetical protein